MSLREYKRKRKFNQTPEPKGKEHKGGKGPLRFVIQMHDASRMHYDFRLEVGGVFKSWAVPKGPSLNPQDQRLAVFVEDHPLDYGSFEGIIPGGNYGAGTVMLWDEGTYVERGSEGRKDSEAAMAKGLAKGHITFVLDGQKLKGEFALIKLKKDKEEKAWLLVKKRDEHSSIKRTQSFNQTSVKTGRTMDEIAAEAEADGDVWLSKRKTQKTAPPPPKKQTAPMPRKNKPMIAAQDRYQSPGEGWIEDAHIDGLRALSEVEGKRVHLYSKSGLPFEKKFKEAVAELANLNVQAVFDGEVAEKIYYIYDILYFDGKDLRERPLSERKKILKSAFKDGRFVKHAEAFKVHSGVIAKNPASTYKSGTSSDWLAIPKGSGKRKTVHDPEQAQLTHPDKIFFPEDGYTKGDVYRYYESVAEYILPYLKDRPESLSRHPNGIAQPGFYQKDMSGHLPKWFKTKRVFSGSSDRTIDYPMVQDKRSLLYIANLGCIEIHPWFSRVSKLDHPDFLVIDLDAKESSFKDVIKIALAYHELLDSIGCANFVKTSGASGLHIGIPTQARYDFDTVREFAEMVSRVVQKKFPALTSMERTPARRRKKIYLDCLQNRRGQTLAAPFCIRPKPSAPVSMPVTWEELPRIKKPEQFNIENALSRIQKFDDPWAPILGQGVDLQKAQQRLKSGHFLDR